MEITNELFSSTKGHHILETKKKGKNSNKFLQRRYLTSCNLLHVLMTNYRCHLASIVHYNICGKLLYCIFQALGS